MAEPRGARQATQCYLAMRVAGEPARRRGRCRCRLCAASLRSSRRRRRSGRSRPRRRRGPSPRATVTSSVPDGLDEAVVHGVPRELFDPDDGHRDAQEDRKALPVDGLDHLECVASHASMIPRALGSFTRLPFAAVPRDYPNVLELVGNTPIVRLERVGRDVAPRLVAKLDYLNPGGSVKDRIGLAMIEAAERDGRLRAGGTIVEPTSGNTGVGLAIAAALKGYRCVFVMPDKIAEEKRALLRAYGAEVVICPTAVPPDSPESYYSVSNRLAEEIPGAFKPDQYSNQANPQAHYETTGPELWEQTGGEIDALVLCVGTGGTVTGTARYLKEQRPDLLVVGADPEGSIFSQPDNIHPYLVEGIGEDFWPTTFDPSLVDEFITVSDRDSFRTARRLAREEGILVGGSGGTAVWAMLQVAERFGPDATIVTIVPDSGRGYLSKVYDDNWLLEHGFLERAAPAATIQAVLSSKQDEEPEVPELVTVTTHQKVGEA